MVDGGRMRRLQLRPLALFGGAGRIVVLAEHLDVAAQRQDADAVFRFAPLEAAEPPAVDIEAEIELLALHAAGLGDEEVSQFVDEDHQPRPRMPDDPARQR